MNYTVVTAIESFQTSDKEEAINKAIARMERQGGPGFPVSVVTVGTTVWSPEGWWWVLDLENDGAPELRQGDSARDVADRYVADAFSSEYTSTVGKTRVWSASTNEAVDYEDVVTVIHPDEPGCTEDAHDWSSDDM